MSQTAEELIGLFERTTYIVNAQAKGLSHADSVLQLPFRGNCFNWVLGHIVESRDKILAMFDQEAILSVEGAILYGRGTDPIADGKTAVSFYHLLAGFNKQHEGIIAALAQTDAQQFNEVVNEEKGSTFASRLSFFHWHETYHTGQLEILRQLAGTDDAIIK